MTVQLGQQRQQIHRMGYFVLVAIAIVLMLPSLPIAPSGAAAGASLRGSDPGAAPSSANADLPHPLSPPVTDNQSAWTNTSIPLAPQSNWTCAYSGIQYCSAQEQSPSLLSLADGQMAVVYSEVVNQTAPTCPGTASYENNSSMDVFIAFSTNSGVSFHGETPVDGNPEAFCPYFNAFDPDFTTNSGGTVFGTFLLTNASVSSSSPNESALVTPSGGSPVFGYTDRQATALAFTSSSDSGTTFAPVDLLVTGNVARPAIAVEGQSVYIVYENISNTTPVASGACSPTVFGNPCVPGASASYPVSLQFISSVNGGATWSMPSTLPGFLPMADPLENNTTGAGSIAVSPTGEIAVAYSANRSCVAFCATGEPAYGDDVVVATSTTNGSTWSGPVVVAQGQGEAAPYADESSGGLFELAPETSIKFGPTAGSLYLAWSASYNISISDPAYALYVSQYDWSRVDLFSAFSSNDGASWTPAERVGPALRSVDPFQQLFGEGYFNPALGVSTAGVYLTYTYLTWTNGACGYSAAIGNAFAQSNVQYVSYSPDGVHWDPAGILAVSTASAGIDYYSDMGFTGSVAFNASGAPVIAYSLAIQFFGFIFLPTGSFELWNGAQVEIDTLYAGPTTTVTLVENGLPAGTPWTGEVQGVGLNTTQTTVLLTHVPAGTPVYIQWPGTIASTSPGGSVIAPVVSNSPEATFLTPQTIYFNFTMFYPVDLQPAANGVPNNALLLNDYGPNGTFYYDPQWYTYGSPPTTQAGGCPEPMYFPSGFNLEIGTNGPVVFTDLSNMNGVFWWNGTGPGSYTGPGPVLNITVNGAINETFWDSGAGNYTINFGAPNLPSSSTFSFSINGHTYTGTGGSTVAVPDLDTGAYQVTNISATSSQAGWDYFGTVDSGNPVIIPSDPSVNLSFALVQVGAAAGKVSFQVNGLSPGTVWHLTVNGTEYGSSTQYINVTLKPSTVPVVAAPILLNSGTEELSPVLSSQQLSVTPGSTYTLDYSPLYRVLASTTQGGNITGAGTSYVIPGTTKSFSASLPQPGFAWDGWVGSGSGSYSGLDWEANVTANGPIQEAASYAPLSPNRFDLVINQTGVPTGTNWTVFVDGKGYTSDNASIEISGVDDCAFSGPVAGTYTALAGVAYSNATGATIRYVPTTPTATSCSELGIHLTFTPQYYGSFQIAPGGSASAGVVTAAPTSLPAQLWLPAGVPVELTATADTGYQFAGWSGTGMGSYTGADATSSFTPGGPVTEVAQFTPIVTPPLSTYWVRFDSLTPLVANTSWSVTLGSTTYSSTEPTLTAVNVAAGTYAVTVHDATSPAGTTEYLPVKASSSLSVSENTTVNVTFSSAYWVEITAAGPGSATPGSGWFPAGSTIALTATPQSAALFESWAGVGAGSYSGANAAATVTVEGSIQETASFAASAPSVTNPTPSSSGVWDSPATWAALAVVGIVVGLGFGYVVSRRSQTPPAPPPEPMTTSDTPEDGP